MKKLSIFFVSVLALGLTTVSCSSDDDKASIEGKWEASQEGTIVDGKEIMAPIVKEGGCSKGFLEIQAGGNVIDHYSEYSNSKCEDYNDNGTWTRTDNKITFKYGTDSEDTGEILVLDKNTLKIKYTYTHQGETTEIYIVQFNRI